MKLKAWTRRSFGCLILGVIPFSAEARFHGGGVASGGGGGLVTTMTLLNTSGATQAIGSCTQIFGHPFAKGDIPSGQYPIFKTAGGTVIPYSISTKKKTWSDGSLQHASFMLRLPVTIAGNQTLSCNIYSGGSAPSASSRSTSDFAAGGLDLNVLVTGQDNLSGSWTSNLNQGVTAAFSDNYVFMDGDAGKVWKIRANARQSGADHGQLEGWWFVQALNDASGNLGGIRHLTRVIQPLYNVSSPAPQYRSFSAFQVRNGSTVLNDLMTTLPAAKNFTWSGSGPNLSCTAHGFEICIAAKLTTTGTLPAGLDTTTLYATAVVDANTFALGVSFNSVAADGSGASITPTNAGSGTHTVSFYPMVSAYGSLFTAGADGRYNYIQGGGSVASDSTIVCQMNNTYWCRTKCLPPYALTSYTPASNQTFTYFPGTAGPINRNTGVPGEDSHIGQISDWYARHVFTQAAVDERAVRVIGLVGGHLPVALYDTTTRSIPVSNNGSYTGMPSANNGFRWVGTPTNYSGFTPPSNTNVFSQGWSAIDNGHMMAFAYYPFLLTGGPEFKEMLAEYGNLALYSSYTGLDTAVVNGSVNSIKGIRNASINGTTYAGIFSGEDGLRSVAWSFRDFSSCAIANFENASYNTYFNDITTDTLTGMAAYRTMLVANATAYVTNVGLWDEAAGNVGDIWTTGYFIGSVALYAGMSESTAAKTLATYLAKWPAYICNNFGTWLLPYYRFTVRKGANSTDLYATSDANIGFYAWNVTWNSGTNLFTLATAPTNYVLNNGDAFVWNAVNGGDGSLPPAGMSGWISYYVINKSGTAVGSTFQLSTTPGGSAVTLTDSQASQQIVYGRPISPPSTGTLDSIVSGSAYMPNIVGVCGWANAIGATVDGAFLTSASARLLAEPGIVAAINANPKYAIGSTYV